VQEQSVFIARQPDWPPRIDQLQREMERFIDHLHRGKRPRVVFSEWAWSPNVDVYSADDQAIVLVELAGVPREQIQIEVEHDHLTLRGVRQPRHHGDGRVVFALEVPTGSFERQVHLPFPVDASQASASYVDGFLEIVLPRSTSEPRRVPIQSTESSR
jgi:HSP20 family protein